MSDPIEAAAWAMFKSDTWSSFLTLDDARVLWKEGQDAYHAAAPSDYDALKAEAETATGLMDFEAVTPKLLDAIENLEAESKEKSNVIAGYINRQTAEAMEDHELIQRAEAAEGALQISEAILATQIEEVAVLRARVASLKA